MGDYQKNYCKDLCTHMCAQCDICDKCQNLIFAKKSTKFVNVQKSGKICQNWPKSSLDLVIIRSVKVFLGAKYWNCEEGGG